ncbi:MAG TPA: glycosyltransferase family 4 protein [Phycisphaerae bacterium]|nr:glycosyltransferase family 4 protein [Phycisphaerae bacterium]
MMRQLAILGSYPPPYAGITLHAQRLCRLLEQRGVDYVLYNATSSSGDGRHVVSVQRRRALWMIRYTLAGAEPAVLILSDRLSAWCAGAIMAALRGKRVVLRLRNSALIDRVRRSGFMRRICGLLLRRMHAIVCVNQELAEQAQALGVEANRVHHLPGFLPPAEEVEDRGAVAAGVWEFVRAHTPVISANGKVAWHDGADLYGLDQLVELVARLRPDYPQVGLIFCFTIHRAADEAYIDALRDQAAQRGIRDNVLLHTAPGLFLPVLAASDAFVRPTRTDGDANSVREALALGVPAVASNVYARPAGAIEFRTGDADDLETKVRIALARPQDRTAPRRVELSGEDRRRADAYIDLLAAVAEGRIPARPLTPSSAPR